MLAFGLNPVGRIEHKWADYCRKNKVVAVMGRLLSSAAVNNCIGCFKMKFIKKTFY